MKVVSSICRLWRRWWHSPVTACEVAIVVIAVAFFVIGWVSAPGCR